MPTQSVADSMAVNYGSCASVSSGYANAAPKPAAGLSPAMMRLLGEAPSVTARIAMGGRSPSTR